MYKIIRIKRQINIHLGDVEITIAIENNPKSYEIGYNYQKIYIGGAYVYDTMYIRKIIKNAKYLIKSNIYGV